MRALHRPVLHRFGVLAFILGMSVLLVLGGTTFALQFDTQRIRQLVRSQHGEASVQKVSAWFDLLEHAGALPDSQRLRAINDFWNYRVRGGDDIHIWGKEDYWATPLETLLKGAGDCEDFVIAKYFSLIRAGVAPGKLRFIYVRAKVGGLGSADTIAHMVLGYYPTPDAEPLILDNLSGSIMPAGRRSDLTPVFSFNAQGVYVPGAATRSVDRIGHWRDLLARMEKEGFVP